jgi:hypothetical protein
MRSRHPEEERCWPSGMARMLAMERVEATVKARQSASSGGKMWREALDKRSSASRGVPSRAETKRVVFFM